MICFSRLLAEMKAHAWKMTGQNQNSRIGDREMITEAGKIIRNRLMCRGGIWRQELSDRLISIIFFVHEASQ